MTFNAYPIGHNEICFGTYDIPGANAGLRNLAQAVFFVLIVRPLIIVVIGLNIRQALAKEDIGNRFALRLRSLDVTFVLNTQNHAAHHAHHDRRIEDNDREPRTSCPSPQSRGCRACPGARGRSVPNRCASEGALRAALAICSVALYDAMSCPRSAIATNSSTTVVPKAEAGCA